MDFTLEHEHQLLQASVRRVLAARGGSVVNPDAPGFDRATWQACAELGLAALDCRGHEGARGDLEFMIVAQEEFGRALAREPMLETVVQCAALLHGATDSAPCARMLEAIAKGQLVAALAHGEADARYSLSHVETTAVREGDGWRIDGVKSLVAQGDSADVLVVSARTSGVRDEPAGITLFTVSTGSPGVECSRYRLYDGRGAADIHLRGVHVTDDARLGTPGAALPRIAQAYAVGIVALAAEAVGCMDALLALTVDYLKTRQQFGRPLGSFQALHHRAADMYVAIEQARSMMLYATMMACHPDPLERERAIAATKVQIGRSARHVGQEAIQLHGGMGMAQEYAAGGYVRRLTAIQTWFGDADHHLARLAGLGGLFAAEAA